MCVYSMITVGLVCVCDEEMLRALLLFLVCMGVWGRDVRFMASSLATYVCPLNGMHM